MNESLDKESLGDFAEVLNLPQESQWAMMSRLGSTAQLRSGVFGVFRKPEDEEAIQSTWKEVLGNAADDFASEIDHKFKPGSESNDPKTIAQRDLFIRLLKDKDHTTVMNAHNTLRYMVKPQIVIEDPKNRRRLTEEEFSKKVISRLNPEQLKFFRKGVEQRNTFGDWVFEYLDELQQQKREVSVEESPAYHQGLWTGETKKVKQDVENLLESLKTKLLYITTRAVNPDLRHPSVEAENAILDKVLEMQASGDPVKSYAEWVLGILPKDPGTGEISEKYKKVERVMKNYLTQ